MYRAIGVMMMAVLLPAAANAQTGDPAKAAAQCVLSRPDAAGFSGIVSVTHGGVSTAWPQGLQGLPGSAPVTAATRFNIGSAGKMFTAVAIGQLIDAGKIGLDDPVGRYVDGLKPETAAVTIRQLLMHTSGLGNFFTPDTVPQLQHLKSLSDLMPLISGDTPRFAPGSRFDYSNTGFALLGLAVERASGTSYGAYLSSHIFMPAGMTATGLSFSEGNTAVGLSSGGGGGMLPPRDGPGGPGREMRGPPPGGAPDGGQGLPGRPAPEASLPATSAGGLYSTAGDITRFFQALNSGKLLRPATFTDFTRAQIESAPAKGDLPALHYGFGFGTGTFENHAWFGHNGGAPGLNAEAVMLPDDDLIIVVLANRDPPAATQVFRAVRQAVLHAGTGQPGC